MGERKGKSLHDMAVRRLVQCRDQIEDIGDIPYAKLRSILLKIERPEQIHIIETNSQHLLGHTDEIWQNFLRRDVPKYDEKPVRPKEGMSWYDLYRKLKRRAEKEQEEQEAELMKKFQANQAERDRNQTTITSKTINPDRKRAARQPTSHSRTGNASLLTFAGGSRTKTNTGAGVINKVRREMAERSTRMGVLGQMPNRPKPLPRPSTSYAVPQRRQENTARPSSRHPDMHTSSTSTTAPSTAPRRPLPPSANPGLNARKILSPRPRPSNATSPDPPSIRLSQITEPLRNGTSPPKRKDATKGGIFMPTAKRKKV